MIGEVSNNAVVVALANKLARIAWAVLRKETRFERGYAQCAKQDRNGRPRVAHEVCRKERKMA